MVFSKRCFSEWCVQRLVRICKGRRHQKRLKTLMFSGMLCLFGGGFPLSQAEVRNLKFGTLRKTKLEKNAKRGFNTSIVEALNLKIRAKVGESSICCGRTTSWAAGSERSKSPSKMTFPQVQKKGRAAGQKQADLSVAEALGPESWDYIIRCQKLSTVVA